jgi:hypothetical protein
MSATVTFIKPSFPGGDWTIRFNYNATIIKAIKDTVPHYAREWNAATKRWTVNEAWTWQLADALTEIGCQVVGLTNGYRRGADNHTATQLADGDWARELFKAVGPQRRDAVYRALSKVLHPDLETGSTQLQRHLNDARDDGYAS